MSKTIRSLLYPLLIVGIFSQTGVTATTLSDDDSKDVYGELREITGDQTLSYRAKLLSEQSSMVDSSQESDKKIENLASLVKEAVSICYDAYGPKYEMIIRRELQRLAVVGALPGPEAQVIITLYVQLFAEAMINQLNSLAHELPREDRQLFWDLAGEEIKLVLAEFCTIFPVEVEVPAEHIDKQIRLKKMFG
jgi:hypothetical protein